MKLTKVALILSLTAALICMGMAIYEHFIAKGDVFILAILALCNLTIFFANLSIYESAKKKQNKEETPAEITEENKEETKED